MSCFFFSSRRRHTRLQGDWSSDVCSSDLPENPPLPRWRCRTCSSPCRCYASRRCAACWMTCGRAPLLFRQGGAVRPAGDRKSGGEGKSVGGGGQSSSEKKEETIGIERRRG